MKKITLKEIKSPVVACLQCYGCKAPVMQKTKAITLVKSNFSKRQLVKHV